MFAAYESKISSGLGGTMSWKDCIEFRNIAPLLLKYALLMQLLELTLLLEDLNRDGREILKNLRLVEVWRRMLLRRLKKRLRLLWRKLMWQ